MAKDQGEGDGCEREMMPPERCRLDVAFIRSVDVVFSSLLYDSSRRFHSSYFHA